MAEPLKWYDANAADNSPWIKALAEVRQRATREGYCYQHVQAIYGRDRSVCGEGVGYAPKRWLIVVRLGVDLANVTVGHIVR
jgi:hypothetical protein